MNKILLIATIVLSYSNLYSASLNISGTISVKCTLNSVTTNTNTNQLPIAVGGTVIIATSSVSCNNKAGYTLLAASANSGLLVNASLPTNTIAYTLAMSGTGSAGSQSLFSQKIIVSHSLLVAPLVNDSRDISITVTPVTVPWSGVYSDTITITMSIL